MRTNIVIDDELMKQAILASGCKTKKDTIEKALKLLIQIEQQENIRSFRGKLKWEGSLEEMRKDINI